MRTIIPKQFHIILLRKVFLVASLSFTVLISVGMSQTSKSTFPVFSEGEMRIQVDQAITSIKTAYESEGLTDFMSILDEDFEERLAFQSNLQSYFIAHKNPELIIITDAVLLNKDNLSVRLHWFKTAFTNDGVFSKFKGSSQLVFNKSSQGLKLLYLRGDNPFY